MNLPGKSSMERSRARQHRKRNVDHAGRIRAHLAAASRPERAEAIAAALGIALDKVRATLKALARAGGVRRIMGDNRHSLWERYSPPAAPEPSGDFRVAAPIRHGRGSFWGAG